MFKLSLLLEALNLDINNPGHNAGVQANNIDTLNFYSSASKVPTILPKFIELLSELKIDEYSEYRQDKQLSNKPYTLEDKINHNEIIIHEDMINVYFKYYYICDEALTTLDSVSYGNKKKLLDSIENIYQDLKKNKLINYKTAHGSISKQDFLPIIRSVSDEIFVDIKNDLAKKIISGYSQENFNFEDINICLDIFLVYVFSECKILEKPEGILNASD